MRNFSGRSSLGAIGGLLRGFGSGMQNRDLFSARLSPSLHCPLEAEPLDSLPPPCPEFPSQPHPWARCGNEAAGWGWPLRELSLGAPHHLWLPSPVAPDPPWSLWGSPACSGLKDLTISTLGPPLGFQATPAVITLTLPGFPGLTATWIYFPTCVREASGVWLLGRGFEMSRR